MAFQSNRRGILRSVLLILVVVLLPQAAQSFGFHHRASVATTKQTGRALLPPRQVEGSTDPAPRSVAAPDSALSASKKGNNNDGGEEPSGSFWDNIDDSQKPGLIFTAVLCTWHFWIGPAIRPIILELKQ